MGGGALSFCLVVNLTLLRAVHGGEGAAQQHDDERGARSGMMLALCGAAWPPASRQAAQCCRQRTARV